MGGRVRNCSDIVHNFCVQIWVGRVGGEEILVNDNKYRFFFSETTPKTDYDPEYRRDDTQSWYVSGEIQL